MTYRDDHDAAVARADALQADLERTQAERDRLRLKVDELEHAIVPVHALALTTTEVAQLVSEIDHAIGDAPENRIGGIGWSVAAFVALVPLYFIGAGVTVLAMAASLGVFGLVLGFRNNHTSARAVRDALRDAPKNVTRIRELEQRHGIRWVEVSTATDTLKLPSREPAPLVSRLARRCPQAKLR